MVSSSIPSLANIEKVTFVFFLFALCLDIASIVELIIQLKQHSCDGKGESLILGSNLTHLYPKRILLRAIGRLMHTCNINCHLEAMRLNTFYPGLDSNPGPLG